MDEWSTPKPSRSPDEKLLLRGAQQGDMHAVALALSRGADPLTKDSSHFETSALHWASQGEFTHPPYPHHGSHPTHPTLPNPPNPHTLTPTP